ncbi:MAG: glycerophosphodiester phosphodiesterase [Chloroflexota bacterium]
MAPVRTLRLAHRGDARRAPENTIASMIGALAVPACDGLEFDVRVSADGVPVICHDETLERVFGRPERIDALAATALTAIGVPTLADLLAAAGRRPFLDVELKVDTGPVLVEVLAAARGPELLRAVVSSFHPAALERVAQLAPRWPTWLNTQVLDAATVAEARALGCRGIAAQWRAIDSRSARMVGAAELELASWTVRRRPTFDRLARLGVVAACVEGHALDG